MTAAGLDRDRRTDDGGAWLRLFGPLVARRAEALDGVAAVRSSTCRAIRWPSRGSACRRCDPPRGWPGAGSAASRRGRCSRGSRRTRCSGSIARCRPRSGSCWGCSRMPSAGRWSAVGLPPWPTRWPRSSAASAARSSPASAWSALDRLPPARAVLLDTTPRAAGGHRRRPAAAADAVPGSRRFRYGSGVFKVDWALDGPVPWTAEGLRRAGTVHLGGTLEEIAPSEAEVAAGRHAERPYVLFVQYAPVGSDARAGGQDHRLGVLPRARRVRRGHDRAGSRPRSSASRPASATGSWPARALPGGDGGARRELRRRRHQRRHPGHPPAHLPAVPSSIRIAWAPGCTCVRHRPRRAAASTA